MERRLGEKVASVNAEDSLDLPVMGNGRRENSPVKRKENCIPPDRTRDRPPDSFSSRTQTSIKSTQPKNRTLLLTEAADLASATSSDPILVGVIIDKGTPLAAAAKSPASPHSPMGNRKETVPAVVLPPVDRNSPPIKTPTTSSHPDGNTDDDHPHDAPFLVTAASKASRKRGVPHVYRDYSNVPDAAGYVRKKTGGVTQPFPEKLHEMLEQENEPSIVSWLPHGRAFLVRKPKHFTSIVMPK